MTSVIGVSNALTSMDCLSLSYRKTVWGKVSITCYIAITMIYFNKVAITAIVAWICWIMTTIVTGTYIISPGDGPAPCSDHRRSYRGTVVYCSVLRILITLSDQGATSKRKGEICSNLRRRWWGQK